MSLLSLLDSLCAYLLGSWVKVSQMVEFPMQDFDIAPYLATYFPCADAQKIEYDLHASLVFDV